MRIDSNLAGVIGRVNRLKNRDIPAAIRSALRPEQWREAARDEAEKTLLALAEPNQRSFIADFLKTLVVDVFGTGFFLRMRSPFYGQQTVSDFQAARSALDPSDLGQNLFMKDVQAFEQLMAEWVADEKEKDKRDDGKTDADIGDWISYEMLAPDGGHVVKHGPNKGRLVRDVFMPHIVEYLQRKQSQSRLDAAVVDTWLRAVLASWRRMVRDLFPEKFRAALHDAAGELPLEAVK